MAQFLTEGPIGKQLFKLTLPMAGGIFGLMLRMFIRYVPLAYVGSRWLGPVGFWGRLRSQMS